MAKCANCKRKFRIRGKIITHETPDYVHVIHPRRGTKGFLFCSKRCLYNWFAAGIIEALFLAAPKET